MTDSVQNEAVTATAGVKSSMRRNLLILVGGLLLLAGVAFAIHYVLWSRSHEETDDAYVAGHVHPVSARVTDTVLRVLVDDNQHVEEGQELVLLDPADYEVKMRQAAAALDIAHRRLDTTGSEVLATAATAQALDLEARGTVGVARAAVGRARAAVTAAHAATAKAEAGLEEADATLQKEAADLSRYEELLAKEQVSRQLVDHARASFLVAQASKRSAEGGLLQTQAQLQEAQQAFAQSESALTRSQGSVQQAQAGKINTDVRKGQQGAATGELAQSKASLDEAQLQLSYTRIVAPITGKIGKKSVESGQRVQIGQPLLALVEDRLWIVANFKETQLARMRQGQRVQVKIDAFPDREFSGSVDSIAPGSGNEFALLPPDNATGNFTKIVQRIPVKIVLDGDSLRGIEGQLTPGMSSTVTVATR